VVPIRVRRYLFIHYTPETLLNHVFEDLRKPKAPNSSTTFLSLSWPKLLSGKYWFSWFSGWFSWYSKTVNRFLDQLSRTLNRFSAWWKPVQPVLKPVHFFLPDCCVSQKAVRSFLKTGSIGFGTDSTGFCAEKSKTASFGRTTG
jgi:hypothetical protein